MLAALIDSFERKVTYLRVSLTDACNFKCVYCVPPSGFSPMGSSSYLNREEIVRFVRLAATVGIQRVRLTGGEPLLRHDIVDIVRDIKQQTSIQDVSITTNVSRLSPLLKPLREAGLDRTNISLDSLDPARFKQVTLSNAYHQVMEAIHQALEMGFLMKLNMVALSGLTTEDIFKFVQFAYDYPLEVRFLEFMPLCGSGWSSELVYPIANIRVVIHSKFKLEEEKDRKDQVAQTFRLAGGKGKVGFIGSLTESFCNDCSRIRITADGKIRPCLFSDTEIAVGDLLRAQASDEAILGALREAVRIKPAGNQFREKPFKPERSSSAQADEELLTNVVMRGIGG